MIDDLKKKFEIFRDDDFKFEESTHTYLYKGVKYISVTTLLSNFHEKFNSDYWSRKKADERGIDQKEILDEWKEKNDYANKIGSSLHNYVENYFLGNFQKIPTNVDIVDRINKFNIIFANKLHKLEPIALELRIFSKKYPIAGTIDSIFLYKDELYIFDWKSNKEFTHDDHPNGSYQKLLSPFEEFYKNHLNEYSIQVSLYSLILEEWGFNIKEMFLLHIGPTTEAKIYRAKDMKDHLRKYLLEFYP